MRKLISYMISDGKGTYIRKDFQGKYTPVRSEALADTWDDRNKARNVLYNQINKNMRNRYKVVEVIVEPLKHQNHIASSEGAEEEHEPRVKDLSNNSIEESQIGKWERGINSLNDFVLDMEERKNELSMDLSNVDKEISDIYHYIECGKFNAYQGWLTLSMLQQRLKRRRKIKNEYQVLSQIGECKIKSSMLADIQEAIRQLDQKTYTPRILTELFE